MLYVGIFGLEVNDLFSDVLSLKSKACSHFILGIREVFMKVTRFRQSPPRDEYNSDLRQCQEIIEEEMF